MSAAAAEASSLDFDAERYLLFIFPVFSSMFVYVNVGKGNHDFSNVIMACITVLSELPTI